MPRRDIHYTNYENHQQQRQYVVFYYYAKDHADYFEALLIEAEIPYERGSGKDLLRRHLIGIHKSYQPQAEALNNTTGNYFRKPFLADNATRYVVLALTLGMLLLALIGYFRAQ